MAEQPRLRFTIGRSMAVIAALAVGFILVMSATQRRLPVALALTLALALPTALVVALAGLVLHYVYNPALGSGCPYCGASALERVAVSSFGGRFYRCTKCGVRCVRVAFGGWKDASDARHDRLYEKKKPDGDPWTGAPGLEDEDLIASETHNSLIRNKRSRRPENPNGPHLG